LCDSSWSILFPDYWLSYRKTASLINVATFKVVAILPDDSYTLECMDIVPEEGRLMIPVGLKADFKLKEIQAALALSWRSTLT
jgi:hypothetical protein